MKKIILTLAVFSIAFSSCKKEEENKVKQVRLKTYTHDYYERSTPSKDKYTIEYNSRGKIAKVIVDTNNVFYKTSYCTYNSANVLDSIVERNAAGMLMNFYNIECSADNKITKVRTTTISYNSNGLVEKKAYTDGSYFRSVYVGDSVLSYYKGVTDPEKISYRCKLSSTIKNPFLISGFEKEAYATSVLFYYNNSSNAFLSNIEENKIEYTNGNFWYQSNYTFVGDFKGYPLQRNDLTNSILDNRSKETFTYEEF